MSRPGKPGKGMPAVAADRRSGSRNPGTCIHSRQQVAGAYMRMTTSETCRWSEAAHPLPIPWNCISCEWMVGSWKCARSRQSIFRKDKLSRPSRDSYDADRLQEDDPCKGQDTGQPDFQKRCGQAGNRRRSAAGPPCGKVNGPGRAAMSGFRLKFCSGGNSPGV